MKYRSPHQTWAVVWILLIIFSALIIRQVLNLEMLLNLFISANVATFFLYGLDKWQSTGRGLRVPEKILWLTAFVGGSIGAITGMNAFRHKTRKTSFQLVLWALILIQVALVTLYLRSGTGTL